MNPATRSNHRLIRFLLMLSLIASFTATLPTARAADFTVADEAELIAAIDAVNAAGVGDHTITLSADVTLTAPLPALDNTEATGILIDGANHTLDGNQTGTVLAVMPATSVTVQAITITGGLGSNGLDSLSGGGIFNRGSLTLIDSTISGNSATTGAGIYNYAGEENPEETAANLVILHTSISDNEAGTTGGGIANTGDTGTATVSLEDSTVSGNSAVDYGGGISSNGHSGTVGMAILRSAVTGNSSDYGGGISNNGNNGEATLTVEASELSGNTALSSGGAIYNNGNLGDATAAFTNTTISGNEAKSGGGITNTNNGGTAEISLAFATLADNSAKTGGSLFNTTGSAITTAASIFSAGDTGAACDTIGGETVTSVGYNLDSDGSCNLIEPTDIPSGAPALEPLALNAPGITKTHAIGANSDAQRQVPSGTHGCGNSLTTDQRGAARPLPGTLCDIGAYESDAAGEEPPTCEPPYAPTTEEELNNAIACVNAAGADTHTVNLAAEITLSGPTTTLDNPDATELLIDGEGRTIDGNQSGTVFTIAEGTTARIRDVTITGGLGSGGPNADSGGGIFNNGKLTVENSTLSGNTAAHGAGIANRGDGSFAELTVVRSTLSGNVALDSGGGIHNSAGVDGSASLNLVNSTLSGNNAVAGGGLLNEADGGDAGANLVYATLADNTATAGGGGLHTLAAGGNSTITLAGTIITNGPGGSPDCAQPGGNLISTGYNLAGDGTCNLTQGSDLPSADAALQSLSLNAPGATATHALSDASEAIDHIPGGAVGCGTAITTDQRGSARPLPAGGMCDIGAYEAQEREAPTFSVYLPAGFNP